MAQITFNCTEEEKQAFLELARQSKTSLTALGQHAIRQVLVAAKAGAQPMLRAADARNAPQIMASGSINLDNLIQSIRPPLSGR
jgi:signal transduction histidine kinase